MTTRPDRQALITRLPGPAGPEVSCDECFELLDQYVDLEVAGQPCRCARMPGGLASLATLFFSIWASSAAICAPGSAPLVFRCW